MTSVTAGTGLGGGTITGSGTIFLLNTSIAPGGTYLYPASVTVNAQGQITGAVNGTQGVTSVTVGAGLSASGNSTAVTLSMSNTSVTPGTYVNAAGGFTVNARGQLTSVTGNNSDVLMSGDVTGNASANTVTNLQTRPLNITSTPAVGSSFTLFSNLVTVRTKSPAPLIVNLDSNTYRKTGIVNVYTSGLVPPLQTNIIIDFFIIPSIYYSPPYTGDISVLVKYSVTGIGNDDIINGQRGSMATVYYALFRNYAAMPPLVAVTSQTVFSSSDGFLLGLSAYMIVGPADPTAVFFMVQIPNGFSSKIHYSYDFEVIVSATKIGD